MEISRHLATGVANTPRSYIGQHHVRQTEEVGPTYFGYSLANPDRVEVEEFGTTLYEERDSVDSYAKYLPYRMADNTRNSKY